MSAAEPVQANGSILATMTSREIRRAFYGFFRMQPGKKPDRKLGFRMSRKFCYNTFQVRDIFIG